jgi:hypothetical protein
MNNLIAVLLIDILWVVVVSVTVDDPDERFAYWMGLLSFTLISVIIGI